MEENLLEEKEKQNWFQFNEWFYLILWYICKILVLRIFNVSRKFVGYFKFVYVILIGRLGHFLPSDWSDITSMSKCRTIVTWKKYSERNSQRL